MRSRARCVVQKGGTSRPDHSSTRRHSSSRTFSRRRHRRPSTPSRHARHPHTGGAVLSDCLPTTLRPELTRTSVAIDPTISRLSLSSVWRRDGYFDVLDVCTTTDVDSGCRGAQLLWIPGLGTPSQDAPHSRHFAYWTSMLQIQRSIPWRSEVCAKGTYIDLSGNISITLTNDARHFEYLLTHDRSVWPAFRFEKLCQWLTALHDRGWCVGAFSPRDLVWLERADPKGNEFCLLNGEFSLHTDTMISATDKNTSDLIWRLPGCAAEWSFADFQRLAATAPSLDVPNADSRTLLRQLMQSWDWLYLETLLRRVQPDSGTSPVWIGPDDAVDAAVCFRRFRRAMWARTLWTSACTTHLATLQLLSTPRYQALTSNVSIWSFGTDRLVDSTYFDRVSGYMVIDLFSGIPSVGWQRRSSSSVSTNMENLITSLWPVSFDRRLPQSIPSWSASISMLTDREWMLPTVQAQWYEMLMRMWNDSRLVMSADFVKEQSTIAIYVLLPHTYPSGVSRESVQRRLEKAFRRHSTTWSNRVLPIQFCDPRLVRAYAASQMQRRFSDRLSQHCKSLTNVFDIELGTGGVTISTMQRPLTDSLQRGDEAMHILTSRVDGTIGTHFPALLPSDVLLAMLTSQHGAELQLVWDMALTDDERRSLGTTLLQASTSGIGTIVRSMAAPTMQSPIQFFPDAPRSIPNAPDAPPNAPGAPPNAPDAPPNAPDAPPNAPADTTIRKRPPVPIRLSQRGSPVPLGQARTLPFSDRKTARTVDPGSIVGAFDARTNQLAEYVRLSTVKESQCPPTSSQHWDGKQCIPCPVGQRYSTVLQKCVAIESKAECEARLEPHHWEKNTCVKCAVGEVWDARLKQCVKPGSAAELSSVLGRAMGARRGQVKSDSDDDADTPDWKTGGDVDADRTATALHKPWPLSTFERDRVITLLSRLWIEQHRERLIGYLISTIRTVLIDPTSSPIVVISSPIGHGPWSSHDLVSSIRVSALIPVHVCLIANPLTSQESIVESTLEFLDKLVYTPSIRASTWDPRAYIYGTL